MSICVYVKCKGMHDLRNMLCLQKYFVFVSKPPDLLVYSFEGSKSICLPGGRIINAINHIKDRPWNQNLPGKYCSFMVIMLRYKKWNFR